MTLKGCYEENKIVYSALPPGLLASSFKKVFLNCNGLAHPDGGLFLRESVELHSNPFFLFSRIQLGQVYLTLK